MTGSRLTRRLAAGAAVAVLVAGAAGCSSGSSAAESAVATPTAGSGGSAGATTPAASAGAVGGTSGAPVASGTAVAGGPAQSADALKKALLTDADLPGYRGMPLPDVSTPPKATSGPPISPDCQKVLGSIGGLDTADAKNAAAKEIFQQSQQPGQPNTVFVGLASFATPDAAEAVVAAMKQGLAGCKIVKGGGYDDAPISALTLTGIGDDSAGFILYLGNGLIGPTAIVTARTGDMTVTVEALGMSGGGDQTAMLRQWLQSVGTRQVAKVKATLGR